MLVLCEASQLARAAQAGGKTESGLATVYSHRLDGHKTASGKIYQPGAMTVAHKTLPFGSKVKITNKRNGRSAVATVTDRGPAQPGRVLDVSPAVAHSLGMHRGGVTPVDVEVQSADGRSSLR